MISIQNNAHRFARHGLLAAALALVVQLFAWAWMPAWSAPPAGQSATSVLICTADGFKSVLLDDHGDPVDSKPDSETAQGHCPLCPLVSGLALAPVQGLATPDEAKRHGPAMLPGSQIATGWFLATLQARAPPALV